MPKRILDEDAWVDGLKKIIEKNYFPDIKRRNLQFSFLGAYFHYLDGHTEVDANSLYNSAHALAVYYNMLLGETPDLPISSPSEPSFLYSSKLDQFSSLSAYLTSTTSEDNASFEKLLEAINAKKREKFAVTYGSTTNTALNMIEQAPISSFPFECHRCFFVKWGTWNLTFVNSPEKSIISVCHHTDKIATSRNDGRILAIQKTIREKCVIFQAILFVAIPQFSKFEIFSII